MKPIGLAGELGCRKVVDGRPTDFCVPQGWIRAVLWDALGDVCRCPAANDGWTAPRAA